MRALLFWFLNVFVKFAASIYGGEGINIALRLMPTQLIAPTLRRYGAQIGANVRFLAPVTIHNSAIDTRDYYHKLRVGADCYLGRELFLDLQDLVHIEDHVTISHGVMILTHTDAGTSWHSQQAVPTSQAGVKIGRGTYVGARVTILQGVEIGAGSIVGAGTLVNKSVPAHSVVIGVPGRIVRSLEGTL